MRHDVEEKESEQPSAVLPQIAEVPTTNEVLKATAVEEVVVAQPVKKRVKKKVESSPAAPQQNKGKEKTSLMGR